MEERSTGSRWEVKCRLYRFKLRRRIRYSDQKKTSYFEYEDRTCRLWSPWFDWLLCCSFNKATIKKRRKGILDGHENGFLTFSDTPESHIEQTRYRPLLEKEMKKEAFKVAICSFGTSVRDLDANREYVKEKME
ncbi:MAG: hypothetical protein QRY74_05075 [Chlamydia sp.]